MDVLVSEVRAHRQRDRIIADPCRVRKAFGTIAIFVPIVAHVRDWLRVIDAGTDTALAEHAYNFEAGRCDRRLEDDAQAIMAALEVFGRFDKELDMWTAAQISIKRNEIRSSTSRNDIQTFHLFDAYGRLDLVHTIIEAERGDI